MDVQVLTKSDHAAHGPLFDAMHRQRHAIFAVQLGWSALHSDTGLEVDQFDDEHAVYLVAHDEDEVCGSVRLLPAWRRSMLLECWPDFVDSGHRSFGETVWEWTRWCPGVAARPRQLLAARRALILGAVAFGQSRGATRFVTLCETKFVDQLAALGWSPEALGPSFQYAEGQAIGVGWALRPNALLETAARLKAPRPVRDVASVAWPSMQAA